MDIRVYPSEPGGTIKAVSSKSAAHRALICEFLAGARGTVEYSTTSKDIEATVACLDALRVCGDNSPILPVGESGSTYRFLIPVVSALGKSARYTLGGRLPQRPLLPLFEDLVSGKVQLSAGVFSVDAGISSQFISGLLFALPLLDGDSELRLTGKAESVPYIDLTVDMLNKFGIDVAFDGEAFYIPGKQHYRSPEKIQIEGDWSNAAFWLAAGIEVTGLDYNSKQGDRAIAEILEDFRSSIDVSDIPDLVPILSVVAASRKGTTTIRNAGRLRIKESDRLAAVTELLTTLGADVTEMEDSLVIRGGKPLKGGTVSSHNDHRIAMSAAIAAATLCTESVVITGAEAVEKSYPHFFEDLRALGGKWEEL